MSTKAKIKSDVIRPHFATCVRAVRKSAEESQNNLIPSAEPSDPEQTLQNATCAVEDTGIRLHGFDNMQKAYDPLEGTIYRNDGRTGEALMHYILLSVKSAFQKHSRLHTFVAIMDKGPFMPEPKLYTQKQRTDAMHRDMERKNIAPLEFLADGSVPELVTRTGVLPPWLAVRANRVMYRHATDQLFALVVEHYRPPAGRRLIIDAIDMAAVMPRTLDEWMVSERIVCDEFAKQIIERTRAALKQGDDAHARSYTSNWRAHTSRVTKELAQAGHFKSVPYCIETGPNGERYEPFLLHNAANDQGEADVGILFWLDALQADRQHQTLIGERRLCKEIAPELAEYYTDEQMADNKKRANMHGAAPLSVASRAQAAELLLDENPDLLMHEKHPAVRPLIAEALPLLPTNPCKQPNRALVLSRDTDFLSLVPLYYAQLCYAHHDDTQYCIDNAPLICIGECQVLRLGWLQSGDDYSKEKTKKRKRGFDEDDDEDDENDADGDDPADDQPVLQAQAEGTARIAAQEVYDVHLMYKRVLELCGETLEHAPRARRLQALASYALFCATCGNDFLAGLYFVNRKHMFQAFCDLRGELVFYDERIGTLTLNLIAVQRYLTHCYYHSINDARGKKNKPPKPALQTTYAEMAALAQKKYASAAGAKKHMPDDARRELLCQRYQWWLVYASGAWQGISKLLDHEVWGWARENIDKLV